MFTAAPCVCGISSNFSSSFLFFFFQAEDGIRYLIVTGVQTCALPICFCPYFRNDFCAARATAAFALFLGRSWLLRSCRPRSAAHRIADSALDTLEREIGRASCRERV